MKRFYKSVLGVTLLEIMLVLAIAAMVIVMSVRYYQSAGASQQANQTLQAIQGIVAAVDNLSQATGQYTASNITSTALTSILSAGGLKSPWGVTIVVTVTGTNSYTINLGSVPANVCPLLVSKLKADNHFSNVPTCSASASTATTITYTSNP